MLYVGIADITYASLLAFARARQGLGLLQQVPQGVFGGGAHGHGAGGGAAAAAAAAEGARLASVAPVVGPARG